jgi:hypothetical protein
MGIVRKLLISPTTPPITKKMAAKSTNPCFKGEIPLNPNPTYHDRARQFQLTLGAPGGNRYDKVENVSPPSKNL